jgi:hypothetical protein
MRGMMKVGSGEGRTNFKHVFSALRLAAVNREGIVFVVDGAPVGEGGFEGGFDFPVLDEILDEGGEGAGFVVRLFRYTRVRRDGGFPMWCFHVLSANILRVLE